MKRISYQVIQCRQAPWLTVKATLPDKELYLHSPYDPIREAARLADAEGIGQGAGVLLFGFGLGYLAREILARIGPDGFLAAVQWVPSLTRMAMEQPFVGELLDDPRFVLIESDKEAEIAAGLKELESLEFSHAIVHRPCLEIMPPRMPQLKNLLQDFTIRKNSIRYFQPAVQKNIDFFMANRDRFSPAHSLFDRFKDMPVMIVSAGPSLDQSLSLLPRAKNRILLLSVGTAVRPLLNAGVEPDLIIVTDPQDRMWPQLAGIDRDIPLITLPTASWRVMDGWKGPLLAAFQEGAGEAEEVAGEWDSPLVETGGSVATTALDVAIKMGGNPIIFAGQDLAYPQGRTHSREVVYHNVAAPKTGYTVRSVNGEDVPTTRVLSLYRRWLERRMEREAGREFINTSPWGARIKGTLEIPIEEVISRYGGRETDFGRLISDATGVGNRPVREGTI